MMDVVIRAQKLPEELGHALGKALEPYARKHLEGHSLTAGILVELYLATKLHNLNHDIILQVLYEVKESYPPVDISCEDYKNILRTIPVRRKEGAVFLRLLDENGTLSRPERVTDQLITEGIDFYRESFGK